MDNPFAVHIDESVYNLLHQVLDLWLCKDNFFPLLKDALQVEFDKLENQVHCLAFAAHYVEKLNDVGVGPKLFEHFYFSERGYWKAVLLVFHFYFFKRVNFVADFSSVDFTECTFVDKLFFFENFGRVQLEVAKELTLEACLRF